MTGLDARRLGISGLAVVLSVGGLAAADRPGERAARFERAMAFAGDGRPERAAELLEPLVASDDFRGEAPELHARAVEQLARSLDVRCADLDAQGRSATAAGDLAGARRAYEALVALRSKSPYLTMTPETLGLSQEPLGPRIYRFMHRTETALRESAVGATAYVLWLAGEGSGVERVLTGPLARRAFSERVADRAYALFESRNWSESSAAYAVAIEQRLQARSGRYDEQAGRLLYNRAMAEFGAGHHRNSVKLLRDLQRAVPEFRSAEVSQALSDIGRMIEAEGR